MLQRTSISILLVVLMLCGTHSNLLLTDSTDAVIFPQQDLSGSQTQSDPQLNSGTENWRENALIRVNYTGSDGKQDNIGDEITDSDHGDDIEIDTKDNEGQMYLNEIDEEQLQDTKKSYDLFKRSNSLGYSKEVIGGQGYYKGLDGGQGYYKGINGGQWHLKETSGGQGYYSSTNGGQGYFHGSNGGQGYNNHGSNHEGQCHITCGSSEAVVAYTAIGYKKNGRGYPQRIQFDRAVSNLGGGWNGGEFRTPVSGTYSFSWSALSTEHHSLAVALCLNSNEIAVSWADRDGYQTAAGSVNLNLRQGDRISLVILEGEIYESSVSSRGYTVFSGHRIG